MGDSPPSLRSTAGVIFPAQLLISVCSLAIPEGSDYLDGRYVSPLALPSCAIPH